MSNEREADRPFEHDAERIARELAKEAGKPALWELYLPDAYERLYGIDMRTDREKRQ